MADQGKAVEWYAVTVVVDSDAEMAVETAFGILDSVGIESDTFGRKEKDTVRVIGYFDRQPAENVVFSALRSALRIHQIDYDALKDVEFDAVVERDWLAEWKKHWKPTIAGKFVVAPPWEKTKDKNKILITIEPAMAFGTGTHETTRLCLDLISKYFLSGMSFLDVGTGTGILSISAAKLCGNKSSPIIMACDIDEHAVEVATENAKLNGISSIEFQTGSISSDTPLFDFACANMTIDIIRPMLPLLLAKAGRILILSGILLEQEEIIRNELSNFRISDVETVCRGEWIALAIKK